MNAGGEQRKALNGLLENCLSLEKKRKKIQSVPNIGRALVRGDWRDRSHSKLLVPNCENGPHPPSPSVLQEAQMLKLIGA